MWTISFQATKKSSLQSTSIKESDADAAWKAWRLYRLFNAIDTYESVHAFLVEPVWDHSTMLVKE